MNTTKMIGWYSPLAAIVLATISGCASAPPFAAGGARETTKSACSGLSDEERSVNLCFATDEILRVERMPIATRGGDVLTGARMVFRATPGRTTQSLQQLVDCQLAIAASTEGQLPSHVSSYCPLAIAGVTATVHPAGGNFSVEIAPKNAAVARRIGHSAEHGGLASALVRFESAECHDIEPRERAACPLLGPVTTVNDVPQGVQVDFLQSSSVDAVLANMRCHYSFAQSRGFTPEAAACPLYMRGLHLERSADGRGISITVAPANQVDAVRTLVREEAVYARSGAGARN